ncbi:MAG: phosphatidate cytidylyltransferase [Thermoplasmatota archaeon]
MEPEFLVGAVSHGAAKVLAIGVGAYAVATGGHALRAYREQLPDRGSAMLATFVMAALTVLLWQRGAQLVPAPFGLAVLGVYMAGVMITFGYTLSNAAKRLAEFREQARQAIEELAAKTLPDDKREAWLRDRLRLDMTPEEKRKTPHLMMGIFLAIYGILGYLILRGVRSLAPGDADFTRESWHNLQAALDAGYLASGHMVGLVCILGLLFLLLPVELVRLQFPQAEYPFKGTITSLMREKERGSFGAHYYITATLPVAIFWLTWDAATWDTTLYAVLAVFGVTVFADAISALVGVRYGRRKFPHNPNKSWMGTFGGTTAAFVLALPFTGVPGAVAAAAVFFLVDVLAPVPFGASDNILNPLGLALVYSLMIDQLDPWLPAY